MGIETMLFTKPGCDNCDYIKDKLTPEMDINIIDMSTADGLADAAFYELIEKTLPILVHNEQIYEGTINIKKQLKTIYDVPDVE